MAILEQVGYVFLFRIVKNLVQVGCFWIVGFVTPIDANNTRVFFWRCRKVSGWQRNVWRFLYRNHLEKLHWDVLEQDRIILENLHQMRVQKSFFINMMLVYLVCVV
jgi:phenylpropionate dioxygenase-like ring-hydroxylating dioxygenase large terminal subunit